MIGLLICQWNMKHLIMLTPVTVVKAGGHCCHDFAEPIIITWLSHITSLIIVSDLVPASLLLGSNHSEPNTSIKPLPRSHLNTTKVSIHYYAHISITSGMCGTLPGTSAHPNQHLITVSHGWSMYATVSANVTLIIPDDEHAIPLIPDPLPSLFLVDNTYVYIYSVNKQLFLLL